MIDKALIRDITTRRSILEKLKERQQWPFLVKVSMYDNFSKTLTLQWLLDPLFP
jgi:hypothetical protein